ncbi:MAG: hypothetical protein GY770_10485, partial [Aestuariibacter sp.]|nr:hypothetical protein [Aestuariibacter sp.]
FTVASLDDALLEAASETFTVNLSATNAAVDDSDTGTGTITDNDSATVTVDDVTVAEGGNLLFTVSLDNAVAGGFDVNLSFTDVTATGGGAPLVSPEDYANDAQSVTFAGTAGETQTFTVASLDDALLEAASETFTVNLSATNAAVDDSDTGTGTITDNDSAAVDPNRCIVT